MVPTLIRSPRSPLLHPAAFPSWESTASWSFSLIYFYPVLESVACSLAYARWAKLYPQSLVYFCFETVWLNCSSWHWHSVAQADLEHAILLPSASQVTRMCLHCQASFFLEQCLLGVLSITEKMPPTPSASVELEQDINWQESAWLIRLCFPNPLLGPEWAQAWP